MFVGGFLDGLSGRRDILTRPGSRVTGTQQWRGGHNREHSQTGNQLFVHTGPCVIEFPCLCRAPGILGIVKNGGDAIVETMNVNPVAAILLLRRQNSLIWIN